MAFFLTAAGAAVACGVEMLEALAIVLAVGVTRRWRDALIGTLFAMLALAVLASVLGPVLLSRIPLEPLRVVIGVLLLLFGLEWLRKGTLRLAGLRARSSSLKEYLEQRAELEELAPAAPREVDWAARVVAFKGVLIEGVEVILIVTALGAHPGSLEPALIGGVAALVAVVCIGVVLRAPLSRLPETHLKYVVGVVLTTFGIFFTSEGLGVSWPLSDVALLYLVLAIVAASQARIAALARGRVAVSA